MGLFIVFFVLVIIYFIWYIPGKSEVEKDNRDLARYLDISKMMDPNKSYDQNLKKILSDPEVRKKAEDARNKANEAKRHLDNEVHKENVIKRIFSYKYEEVIYEIFSPYGEKRTIPYRGQTWEVNEYLEIKFVIDEIARIMKVSQGEAEDLFKEFIKNNLIFTLSSKNSKKCKLGSLLLSDWDIVSEDDMNFSKWMDSHPNVETKADANKRRRKYDIVKYIPLADFVKKHGHYDIEKDGVFYEMYFEKDETCVQIYGEDIGADLETNVDRLKDIITNTDKLFVEDDDGYLTLKRKV